MSRNRFTQVIESNWGILLFSALIVCFVVLLAISFFWKGKSVMETRLKDSLRNTAAAAAMQFSPFDIERIHDKNDMDNPSFHVLVDRLKALRENIPDIRFSYIMRRTDDPATLRFVADSDALSTVEELDVNDNGKIDADEKPSFPGDLYDATAFPAMREAFLRPSVDSDIATDEWGALISGYAPIHDMEGNAIAILGLDMDASDYLSESYSVLSPVSLLLVIIGATIVGGGIFLFIWKRRLEAIEQLEVQRTGLLRLAFHQLGSPLSIIRWSVELIQERNSALHDPVIDDQIGAMSEGVNRLSNILTTLYDANRVHTKTLAYSLEFGRVDDTIKEIVREMQPSLKRKSQKLTLELSCNQRMKLDQKIMKTVIRELIDNAMGYSPDESTITIRTHCEDSSVHIDVQDEGYGIAEGDLSRIFEEFVRGSNAARYRPDGSGLGLYIIRGMIEQAGGTIKAKSTVGKGTTMSITLPFEESGA